MSTPLIASLCLVLVAPAEQPDTPKAAVAFVGKLQNEDGGYRAAPKEGPSSLRATSTALRAIKYSGGQLPRKEASEKFVAACFDRGTGGFQFSTQEKAALLAFLKTLSDKKFITDPKFSDPFETK